MKQIKKTCAKGHIFYKSSECLTCPTCESLRAPVNGFLDQLSAPARRALETVKITSFDELSKKTEKEILALHGVGPASLPILRKSLEEKGLSFRRR